MSEPGAYEADWHPKAVDFALQLASIKVAAAEAAGGQPPPTAADLVKDATTILAFMKKK